MMLGAATLSTPESMEPRPSLIFCLSTSDKGRRQLRLWWHRQIQIEFLRQDPPRHRLVVDET